MKVSVTGGRPGPTILAVSTLRTTLRRCVPGGAIGTGSVSTTVPVGASATRPEPRKYPGPTLQATFRRRGGGPIGAFMNGATAACGRAWGPEREGERARPPHPGRYGLALVSGTRSDRQRSCERPRRPAAGWRVCRGVPGAVQYLRTGPDRLPLHPTAPDRPPDRDEAVSRDTDSSGARRVAWREGRGSVPDIRPGGRISPRGPTRPATRC